MKVIQVGCFCRKFPKLKLHRANGLGRELAACQVSVEGGDGRGSSAAVGAEPRVAECCAAAQWDAGGTQSVAGASAGAGARWHGPRQTSARLDVQVDSSAAAALLWLRRVRDELSLISCEILYIPNLDFYLY